METYIPAPAQMAYDKILYIIEDIYTGAEENKKRKNEDVYTEMPFPFAVDEIGDLTYALVVKTTALSQTLLTRIATEFSCAVTAIYDRDAFNILFTL